MQFEEQATMLMEQQDFCDQVDSVCDRIRQEEVCQDFDGVPTQEDPNPGSCQDVPSCD